MNSFRSVVATSVAACLALTAVSGQAQEQVQTATPAAPPPGLASSPPAGGPPTAPPLATPATLKLREGTELTLRFNEKLSSATNKTGDQFSVTLDDDVKLPSGTIIRAGYRGKGEVTAADKKGMMGKAGELNIRINYLRIGDDRVRVRAQKGGEGKDGIGWTVGLTILFGPLGLLKRGHDIDIPSGQTITAFVDSDIDLSLPLPAPPKE